jgi:hypothetical protein
VAQRDNTYTERKEVEHATECFEGSVAKIQSVLNSLGSSLSLSCGNHVIICSKSSSMSVKSTMYLSITLNAFSSRPK